MIYDSQQIVNMKLQEEGDNYDQHNILQLLWSGT